MASPTARDARAAHDDDLPEPHAGGLTDYLGITITQCTADHVEATMPITEHHLQGYGFLHGGATCALLETVGGVGMHFRFDPATERVFGVDIHIRHRRSGVRGVVTGIADFDHVNGNEYYYRVRAVDEDGCVLSDGVVMNKKVSIDYLRRRRAEQLREEERKEREDGERDRAARTTDSRV
ncbi:PaaI family thioesterase [Bifidobacterium avesanii]|uniref:Hotdog fold thioesterase n=1 Tax=Bifidobacterium avesanii TaxID=1798157 RepID=A0A7K3TFP8_9BIFI|nr:PaaI family thioesterase [Bifidobacterium avesanii]KAB8291457.1 thioesterase [Bifidobacterium avesanii]NEG77911.1 hotdog fold thioesterase [Bifidobacterium avesanii]